MAAHKPILALACLQMNLSLS